MSRPARSVCFVRPAVIPAALLLAAAAFFPPAAARGGDDAVDPPPLTGTVVDAAGVPVAGAEVGTLSATGPAYTLTTDAGGRFEMPLNRYPDGRVNHPELIARGPGGDLGFLYYTDPAAHGTKWGPGVNADGTVTVSLALPRRVPVVVTAADGAPVGGVPVYAVLSESLADAAETNADGTVVLAVPGSSVGVRVVAAKAGVGYGDVMIVPTPADPAAAVGGVDADDPAGPAEPTAVTLVPTFAQKLRLVAVGPGGATAPAAGARVNVTLVDRSPANDLGTYSGDGARAGGVGALAAVAGADGVAVIDWLPTDLRRANCEATLPGHAAVLFEIEGGGVGGDRTVELVADGTLAGLARYRDGTPAAGVRVTAHGSVSGSFSAARPRFVAVTNDDGAYAMTVAGRGLYLVSAEPPPPDGGDGGGDGAGAGAAEPRFASPIAGRDGSLIVLPGALAAVPDLTFLPGVKISGRVTAADDTPAGGVKITLGTFALPFPAALERPDAQWSRGPEIYLRTETDADGRYVLRAQPGEYRANVRGVKWSNKKFVVPANAAALTRNFTLEPEKKPIVYTGRVTDVSGDPVAGATVVAGSFFDVRDGEGDGSAVTGADGRFELEAVEQPIRTVLTAIDPVERPPGRDRRRAMFWDRSTHSAAGPFVSGRREGVNLTLHPHVAVTGTAAGPTGESLAGLPFELRGPALNTPLGGLGPLNALGSAGPRGRWVFTGAWGGAENRIVFRDGNAGYVVGYGTAGTDPDGPVTDFGAYASKWNGFPFRSLEKRRDAAFAAPADLPDRVPALAQIAGRMGRRALLLVADPDAPAGRDLFDAVYEDFAGAAAADAGFLTQVVPAARAADVPAAAGADVAPAGLIVLEPDGAVVAARRFDPVDPAAALAFLKEHAPPAGGVRAGENPRRGANAAGFTGVGAGGYSVRPRRRPAAGSGEVAEWSNVPDSKSGVPSRVPGVRIPPSPLCPSAPPPAAAAGLTGGSRKFGRGDWRGGSFGADGSGARRCVARGRPTRETR